MTNQLIQIPQLPSARALYCISVIIDIEGGYVNDPRDPGGETNYGISKASYPDLDVKNLSIDQATKIYYRDYWLRCSADKLPKPLDLAVFDAAVNQGLMRAIKLLQLVCRVKIDGKIGLETLKAVRSSQYQEYLTQRAILYAHSPNVNLYGHSWFMRLFKIANR